MRTLVNTAYAELTEGMTKEERGVFDAKLGGIDRKARTGSVEIAPGVVDPNVIAPNNAAGVVAMMQQVPR